MKRIVLTSGLIAGGILAAVMAVTMPLANKGSFSHSEVFGYSAMVLAFVMIFVGIRSYRETIGGGRVTFGKGFQIGILITLIASVIYVATWEILYWGFLPDFGEHYSAFVIQKMHGAGASAAAIAAKQRELVEFQRMYKNPLFNIAMTFIEVFPVGLIITLVSAAILRRSTPKRAGERVAAAV
jgi:hypothetical protein